MPDFTAIQIERLRYAVHAGAVLSDAAAYAGMTTEELDAEISRQPYLAQRIERWRSEGRVAALVRLQTGDKSATASAVQAWLDRTTGLDYVGSRTLVGMPSEEEDEDFAVSWLDDEDEDAL